MKIELFSDWLIDYQDIVKPGQNKPSRCVQCRYSKDVTTGEGTMSGSGDGLVTEDCFDLSGAKDEELTSDCARGGGIGGGNGFCYNEFTMEWRPGEV